MYPLNKASKRVIHTFVVGRRGWLFVETPRGASVSGAVYSLIETAKANGLNVFAYLQHLFLHMTDLDWRNHPKELDGLMSWALEVQEQCK